MPAADREPVIAMRALVLLCVLAGSLLGTVAAAHPGSETCAMFDDPLCWTIRLGCNYADGPLDRMVKPNPIFAIQCTTQPCGDGCIEMAS